MICEDEIDAQLRRILESPVFAASERSKQFLEFCVNYSRAGQGSVKETTIALEVFMRPANYDPKRDPIVRVHARRVREKLHLYYRTVGAGDPIKIDIPKGGYVPVFQPVTVISHFDQESEPETPQPLGASAIVEPTQEDAAPVSRQPWMLWVVTSSALAIIVSLVWMTLRMMPSGTPYLHALKPISALPDGSCDPSWSPDGNLLAFAAPDKDNSRLHIFVKDFRSADPPQQISMDARYESRPVWSPDGKELAFVRSVDSSHFEIVRVKLSDRSETTVGRFVSYWPIRIDRPSLDWSRDGRYFLTAEQTAPTTPMRLVVVSAAGDSRRILTSPRSISSGDVEGKFSPDGQLVAFRRGGQGDLFVVSIRGELAEPARELTHGMRGVRGIAWEKDGRSILFGSQRNKTAALGIWRVDVSGGGPTPVTETGFDTSNPTISSGGAIVVEHREVVSELAEQALDAEGSTHPVFTSNALDSAPAYSPDGKSVAFISTRSGCPELWLQQDGTPPVQVTHLEGTGIVFMPSWAPDGHAIVFSARQDGATNLYVDDLRKHSLRELTSTVNRDINPVYSSDGRSIFFSSNDDGTSRIWRMREDGRERSEPLFVEATVGFQPSPDGKWLYYLQTNPSTVLERYSLIDGTTEEIFRTAATPAFFNSLNISGSRIFIAVSDEDKSSDAEVYEIEPETKHVRMATVLHDIAPYVAYVTPGMSVSPDGKKVMYARKKNDRTVLFIAN